MEVDPASVARRRTQPFRDGESGDPVGHGDGGLGTARHLEKMVELGAKECVAFLLERPRPWFIRRPPPGA